jgi:hypothetical protein
MRIFEFIGWYFFIGIKKKKKCTVLLFCPRQRKISLFSFINYFSILEPNSLSIRAGISSQPLNTPIISRQLSCVLMRLIRAINFLPAILIIFFSTLNYYFKQTIQTTFVLFRIASHFYCTRANRKITIFSLSSLTILNSSILTLFFA